MAIQSMDMILYILMLDNALHTVTLSLSGCVELAVVNLCFTEAQNQSFSSCNLPSKWAFASGKNCMTLKTPELSLWKHNVSVFLAPTYLIYKSDKPWWQVCYTVLVKIPICCTVRSTVLLLCCINTYFHVNRNATFMFLHTFTVQSAYTR
jgi:hypothetical protein